MPSATQECNGYNVVALLLLRKVTKTVSGSSNRASVQIGRKDGVIAP